MAEGYRFSRESGVTHDGDPHAADFPYVVVVVVGYGEKRLTSDCLASLRGLEYRPLSVIYVDNASPDGALEHVRRNCPEVDAIPSGGNIGYCGGNNVGIARALESGADYVLILNPDTIVCNDGFISTLVEYMERHPTVGKVGPKVYLRKHGDVQNTVLSWPSIWESGSSILRTVRGLPTVQRSASITEPTEVPALNGCCLLVRAEAFRAVGMYDAALWGYMDEVDWDAQADRFGWKRHYVPVESIIHFQKESANDFTRLPNYYNKRNTAIWYARNGKWFSMAAWMVITLSIALWRTLTAPLLGRSLSKYGGFLCRIASAYFSILRDLACGTLGKLAPAPGSVRG